LRKIAVLIVAIMSIEARADEVRLVDPHFYMSSLAGVSFGTLTDFRPRYAPFQVGLTLFNTKKLFIGKAAYGFVIEKQDTGNSGVGHAFIFSPLVWKIWSFDWGRSWNRQSALTLDLGIDHRRRIIAAFGFAF
jgi:hypothetical protein